jgi:hypothetical protein
MVPAREGSGPAVFDEPSQFIKPGAELYSKA